MEAKEFINILKRSKLAERIKFIKYFPASEGKYATPQTPMNPKLKTALLNLGINRLYTHQVSVFDGVKEGKNIILTTPTASGKTLSYNLPVMDSLISNPKECALYLFPTKALTQDQFKTLQELRQSLNLKLNIAIYDGDTSSYQRRKIKTSPPQILLTNPDMLHQGIISYHASWEKFIRCLKFIILDEVHTYRGIFGSHVSCVLRRLLRLCHYYKTKPQFICSSATIANPAEFAQNLTRLSFEVIKESGAPQNGKYFILWEPETSPYREATNLFLRCLDAGFKTIVFTKSRKITELIHRFSCQANGMIEEKIKSYRAGYLPQERREIERRLFYNELQGVISTSALELGIDVGELDVCILVGYPGSIISTWHRAGRVGRGKREALIFLISLDDALDHFFMENPEDFFKMNFESSYVNNDNPIIMKKHLECALSELPFNLEEDKLLWGDALIPILSEMQKDGEIMVDAEGKRWFSRKSHPQSEINLRSIGKTFQIREKGTNNFIGTVEYPQVMRECHPGAIYLHSGLEYKVQKLDLDNQTVVVEMADVDYYTQPRSKEDVKIIKVQTCQRVGSLNLKLADAEVTEQVTSYVCKSIFDQTVINEEVLNLPPYTYQTHVLVLEIPNKLQKEIREKNLSLLGGLHAVEHSLIAAFPLIALCDRQDLGGVSYEYHPQVSLPVIFIYDGYPGGVGLVKKGYDDIISLFKTTYQLVSSCSCEMGCPACVQSPKCGSGNRPLDKTAALIILRNLSRSSEYLIQKRKKVSSKKEVNFPSSKKKRLKSSSRSTSAFGRQIDKKVIFFDLETQNLAEEVGGWENKEKMRLSLAVIYNQAEEKYKYFTEENINELLEELTRCDLVVGFNIKGFDWVVLQPYFKYDLNKIPVLDLSEEIYKKLNFRVSLQHLAQVTLSWEKWGDGVQAVTWFREGNMEELKRYCQRDVEIVIALYEFGKKYKYLLFKDKYGEVLRIPVDW